MILMKFFDFFAVLIMLIFQTVPESQNTKYSSSINVNDFGIYGKEKDVTYEIQDLLDFVNTDQIKEIYFPKGTYIISTPIKLNHSIKISGDGAVFKLSTNFTSNEYGQGFFYSDSVHNISFQNIQFDGNKDNLTKDPINNFALLFKDSSHIKVVYCTVTNLNGWGSNLNSAFSFIGNSNNIQAEANIIQNSNGGAIFFQGNLSNAINNTAINLKDVAYVANGIGSKNVVFSNNLATSISSGSIGIENGASKITIENNKMENITNGYGIGILKIKDSSDSISTDITINNNEIIGNSGSNPSNAIAIVQARNVTAYNNTITGINTNNQFNNSIYLGANTDNISVYQNNLVSSTAPGIVNNSKLKNNMLYNNTVRPKK